MIIAAHYYLANPTYFRDLARKALEDDAFVPSKKAYEKMVENKFATKVIESALSTPKFYTVLFAGDTAPTHVEERSLKKGKR